MPNPTCTLPDCEKPSRNPRSPGLCKMHYHRQYRHGSVDKVATNVSTSNGRRYRSLYLPRHPLASRHGKVYAHRAVLYDAIGPGPHACHHCGTPVDWLPKGHPAELQPDHLNHDGGDNRRENLVPSCRPCNTRRGLTHRHRALSAAGWWSGHDTVGRLHDRRLID